MVAAGTVAIAAAFLYAAAFYFLYRQSRAAFFALWAAAWTAQTVALVFAAGGGRFLAAYTFCEFAFAMLLIAAARAGRHGRIQHWWSVVWLLALYIPYVAALYILNRPMEEMHRLLVSLLSAFAYFYSVIAIRPSSRGISSTVLRAALLGLAVAQMFRALIGRESSLTDLALNTLLVLSTMAMWIESQQDRIRELGAEVDRVRRETRSTLDLDGLTGLFNQTALARRMEEPLTFEGIVVVCDMDNFKQVNDRYGHLVGDEILRSVGNLLRASIRQNDEAFRWGGDEFVILFGGSPLDAAVNRMQSIQDRLRDYRVRGFGALPISFSWGAAATTGQSLREALDEADRNMYERKKARPAYRESVG